MINGINQNMKLMKRLKSLARLKMKLIFGSNSLIEF